MGEKKHKKRQKEQAAHVDAVTGEAVKDSIKQSVAASFADASGSDDEPSYSISQVAQIMGVAPSALRYYDHEGLLPHVERVNGVRVFRNKDFPWLRVLQCLKNTGIPIRRIKEYAQLCELGDASLEQRYELIKAQRQSVLDQIEQLKFYLQELDFKDWYYRTAIAAGTESTVHVDDAPGMDPDRIPDYPQSPDAPQASEHSQSSDCTQTSDCPQTSDRSQTPAPDGFFGMGAPNDGYAQYFSGQSYLKPVSKPGDPLAIHNVTFEPGCRSNWHIHHATKGGGQILICVDGEGWCQFEGQPAQRMLPGDVVEVPANMKHWHGAAKHSWFSHLAFMLPGEGLSNEWLEPVTDAEYDALEA